MKKYGFNYENLNKIVKQYKEKGFDLNLKKIKGLFNKSVLTEGKFDELVNEALTDKMESNRVRADTKYLEKLNDIVHEKVVYGVSQIKIRKDGYPLFKKEENVLKTKHLLKEIKMNKRKIRAARETLSGLTGLTSFEEEPSSYRNKTEATRESVKSTKAKQVKLSTIGGKIFKCTTQLPDSRRKSKKSSRMTLGTLRRGFSKRIKEFEEQDIENRIMERKVNYYMNSNETFEQGKKAFLKDICNKVSSKNLAEGEIENDIKAYFKKLTSKDKEYYDVKHFPWSLKQKSYLKHADRADSRIEV